MKQTRIKTAILGATGYTGAELVRLLVDHPYVDIAVLTSQSEAGEPYAQSFPQMLGVPLPNLIRVEDVDWGAIDCAFCALPHGTTQEIIATGLRANPSLKIIDLSADFRLNSLADYEAWYGAPHAAPDLQREAVYGLSEIYRSEISGARLVANPGCYPTASLLPLIPLLKAGLIDPSRIVIDAKSGVSGAGRGAKRGTHFCEVSTGFHAYGVGHHRHMAELDAFLSAAAGVEVRPRFTPHLIPVNRGMLATIYIDSISGVHVEDIHTCLVKAYGQSPFVHILGLGQIPQTRFVLGSNMCQIGVSKDRAERQFILTSVIDNLVKGASGQAIQNFNLVFGFEETLGLPLVAVFP